MWVKHGEGGDTKFFVLVNNKLPVSAIASFWKLEPSSLCIGEDVVLFSEESSGNSVVDAESFLQTVGSLGLGDGSSKESALPITGKPAENSGSLSTRLKSLIKRPDMEEAALKRKRNSEQYAEECERLFFSDGALHAYTHRVANADARVDRLQLLQSEVGEAGIIGGLHVVSKPGETPDSSNRRGMVTLVRPDGTCVTSSVCMGTLAGGERYVVRLGGSSYECTGSSRLGLGILMPVPGSRQSFSGCAIVRQVSGTYGKVCSAGWDREKGDEVRLVNGRNMGFDSRFDDWEAGLRYVMMAGEEAEIEIGAPLLEHTGGLTGVVTGFGRLQSGRKKSKMGAFGFPANKSDFTQVYSSLTPVLAQVVRKCVEVNSLVYFTEVAGKIDTPFVEWKRERILKRSTEQDPCQG